MTLLNGEIIKEIPEENSQLNIEKTGITFYPVQQNTIENFPNSINIITSKKINHHNTLIKDCSKFFYNFLLKISYINNGGEKHDRT